MERSEGFMVVVDADGRYSVLRTTDAPREGWKPAGKTGPLKHCLAYIEEVWTDMRPAGWKQEILRRL